MTAPALSPEPVKRSKRMVVWLVAVPIVILLLALAGANWKTFHLAYAKHLMRSAESADRKKGAVMMCETHVRAGMPRQEVSELLKPATLHRTPYMDQFTYQGQRWYVVAGPKDIFVYVTFDKNDAYFRHFSAEPITTMPKIRWGRAPASPK